MLGRNGNSETGLAPLAPLQLYSDFTNNLLPLFCASSYACSATGVAPQIAFLDSPFSAKNPPSETGLATRIPLLISLISCEKALSESLLPTGFSPRVAPLASSSSVNYVVSLEFAASYPCSETGIAPRIPPLNSRIAGKKVLS